MVKKLTNLLTQKAIGKSHLYTIHIFIYYIYKTQSGISEFSHTQYYPRNSNPKNTIYIINIIKETLNNINSHPHIVTLLYNATFIYLL